MLEEMTAETSFTRIEEHVRRLWRLHGIAEAFCAPRQDAPPYLVDQQPLAVAGQSWADQVRLLAAGDLMARYLTMRGFAVRHKLGWECHGLRVETAVEQSLGPEGADCDLAQFNAACRAVAVEGIAHGEALADHLGVWFDAADTYNTMTPQAIGAVWGALRQLWDAGRLKRERRVVSICPRCATPLSAAESIRRAPEAEGRSIWVRLPWDGESDAYFLIWTPAAWTLAGMVALAVHPDANYALVEMTGRRGRTLIKLLLAEAALERTLTDEHHVVRRLTARQLRRARYRPLFTFLPAGQATGRIVISDQVPLDQGTGLLPVTPSSDARSLALAQAHDLPIPELLDRYGGLTDAVTPWRGLSPLDAEPLLVEDVRVRGLLFGEQVEARSRPICPHCDTPLLPQIRDVWLVETGSEPWLVSRDRTWGAPLPVWACENCGQQVCLAGLDDLGFRTGLDAGPDAGQIDPHRPDIDRITFPCKECAGTMRRVTPVVDAAFEAAVVPWAMPARTEPPQRAIDSITSDPSSTLPRSLAVGLGDRDLGWLGDLTEIVALLRGSLAWEQAIALPEGVVGAAWDSSLTPPADVLRWAAHAGKLPAQAERDVLRPLWHLVSQLAARAAQPLAVQPREEQAILNRWLLARLHQVIGTVTEALDACEPCRATDALATLVHDLSTWYAPPWPNGEEQLLETLSRLLAPFVPHLAEAIYRQIGGRTVESVHLLDWPSSNPSPADRALLAGMALVWRLVALGKIARGQAGLQLGQPLRRAVITFLSPTTSEPAELIPYKSLLARLLGVARVQFTREAIATKVWQLNLNANDAVERAIPAGEIDAALTALSAREAAKLVFQLWDGRSVSLKVAGQMVTLLPSEVRVSTRPGWAAAAAGGRLLVLEVG
jgi:isoleucyl-tRNA synthetase